MTFCDSLGKIENCKCLYFKELFNVSLEQESLIYNKFLYFYRM